MIENKFFSTLFKDGEYTCFGDRFANSISCAKPEEYFEYFSINPMHGRHDFGYLMKDGRDYNVPRRADINVVDFRNFLFEMDSIGLEDQRRIFENCGIPFTSIVYSGGKSYHAILGLSEGLKCDYNCIDSSKAYKRVWRRLAAYIDRQARSMGYEYPEGCGSFIDRACSNPSRLSRFPNSKRANGNVQKLIVLGELMSIEKFEELLNKCPQIFTSERKAKRVVENPVETVEEFWRYCPTGLKNKLRYVDWAGPSGCYEHLRDAIWWAWDATGVPKDVMLEVLWDRTFIRLLEAGYPEWKLTIPLDHVYNAVRGR